MKYKIDDLTATELSIIALAVDFYLCNADKGVVPLDEVEELFLHIDTLAEVAEEEVLGANVIAIQDNLIEVDFTPKDS